KKAEGQVKPLLVIGAGGGADERADVGDEGGAAVLEEAVQSAKGGAEIGAPAVPRLIIAQAGMHAEGLGGVVDRVERQEGGGGQREVAAREGVGGVGGAGARREDVE